MMQATSACENGEISASVRLKPNQSALSLGEIAELDALGRVVVAPATSGSDIQAPSYPVIEDGEVRKTELADLRLGALIVLVTAVLFYGAVALLIGRFL